MSLSQTSKFLQKKQYNINNKIDLKKETLAHTTCHSKAQVAQQLNE